MLALALRVGQQSRTCFVGPFRMQVELDLLARVTDQADNRCQMLNTESGSKQWLDEEHAAQSMSIQYLQGLGQAIFPVPGAAIHIPIEAFGKIRLDRGPVVTPDFNVER